eukprot:6652390-Karenia_brevis.AAC.1
MVLPTNETWDIGQAYEVVSRLVLITDLVHLLEGAENTKNGIQQIYHAQKFIASHAKHML